MRYSAAVALVAFTSSSFAYPLEARQIKNSFEYPPISLPGSGKPGKAHTVRSESSVEAVEGGPTLEFPKVDINLAKIPTKLPTKLPTIQGVSLAKVPKIPITHLAARSEASIGAVEAVENVDAKTPNLPNIPKPPTINLGQLPKIPNPAKIPNLAKGLKIPGL